VKIAVSGKGGVGKTTLAAMPTGAMALKGRGVIAIDADPDANLATMLGMSVERTIGHLREDVLREIRNLPAGMSKQSYIEAGFHQIIVEGPKVDLITMGRGEGPGCYCFINDLLRRFAEDLMPSYRWVVMDNEAGLEHLSRRTATRIDHLIVVVNDSPLSADSARRIDQLLGDLGREVGGKYFLLNAVRADRAAAVRERMAGTGLEYLGAIPRDERVEESAFRGESVYALDDSPAIGAVAEAMKKMGAE
jgi:CO dehydrogenase maturation factor